MEGMVKVMLHLITWKEPWQRGREAERKAEGEKEEI